ncbi:DNA-binding protein [Neptunicella sp.]|uniref:DNA-binding protein n=1 Tax=Neptunicella sp. TaxID=2125986 RepID=UPI003F693219
MARHPEVTEKAIIQAGLEIEKLGKAANPGAIRVHLGYRGGLMRIKSIWEGFVQKRSQKLLPDPKTEVTLDSLPNEYSSNAVQLMERVSTAIEQLTVEAYIVSQQVFEKRLKTMEKDHEQRVATLNEAEVSADMSIKQLENELDDVQKDLQDLADQNAKLLIENSELRGRLSVFEESYPASKQHSGN